MSKSKFFSKDFKGTAFDRACVKIEIDPNYINGVSNKELFNLVVDEKGGLSQLRGHSPFNNTTP
ncbi:hypothetical protein SE924_12040 [Legionella pneumophila]|nr:hypothetical protein [Legionella pneumophila]